MKHLGALDQKFAKAICQGVDLHIGMLLNIKADQSSRDSVRANNWQWHRP